MTKEVKETCATKCWRLDRRNLLCEKHNQPVQKVGAQTYQKCEKCLEETRDGRWKF